MSAAPSPSPAQIAANQAKAQHSTGPRTAVSKAIVAKNRTTHGLVGAHTILPHEDPNAFAGVLTKLRENLDPQGPAEAFLVDSVAHAHWKLARIAGWESEITASAFENQPVPEALAKLLGATHEQFHSNSFPNFRSAGCVPSEVAGIGWRFVVGSPSLIRGCYVGPLSDLQARSPGEDYA